MKPTIEQLATALGKKVWSKNGSNRIYIDAGYNTKKMKTTAYIYEVDGEFKVSCFIDCPSQPMAWINSQKQDVIDSIESQIEEATSKALNPEKYSNMPHTKSVKSVVYHKPVVVEKPVAVVVEEKKKAFVDFTGEKFQHPTFGIGKKIEETKDTIKLLFEVGEKNLLKKFANLQPVA